MTVITDKKAYYDLVKPEYLTWDFVKPFTYLEPKFGSLGLIVYYRTYSRYIPELRRRESWWEMILRVVEYSISLYKGPASREALVEEAEELYEYIFEMKVFPAGRTFWVGGTEAVKKDATSNFNCSFTAVEEIKSYVDMFHLLLVGAGTGFSVEKRYIDKLPLFNKEIVIKHGSYRPIPKYERIEDTKLDETILGLPSIKTLFIEVGDSKAGWCQALEAFLSAATVTADYDEINFNYNSVRPAGERLKTMGGRASGPGPLRTMFEEISSIIQSSDGRLTSVEAMDISNSIAKAVVVGGVRRSSQISLGDVDDTAFISAKENLWTDESKANYRTTRVMSNNSVMFWEKPTKNKLKSIFDKIKELGEPGFINAEAASRRRPNFAGLNPCAEILLADKGVCVASDTLLITKSGITTIEQAEGEEVEVWNGKQWSKVTPFQTGRNQKLLRVKFGDGSYLDTTEGHRFSVRHRFQKSYSTVEAKDLMSFSDYVIHTEPFHMEYEGGEDVDLDYAYTLGVLVGDGNVDKNKCEVTLYGKKINLPILGNKSSPRRRAGYSVDEVRVRIGLEDFSADKLRSLRVDDDGLDEIFSWSKQSILSFIAGLADTDGSEASNGIRVYLTGAERAKRLQLLLTKVGVRSSVNLMSLKGTQTNKGIRGNDIYYLQITDCASIPCHRLDTTKGSPAKYKGKFQTIVSVEELPGLHNSFCFTEAERHMGVFGNTLTYQCNLTEVNVRAFVTRLGEFDYSGFKRALTLASRMGSRITNVTMWDAEWDEIQKRDRLLGVSLTGQVEAWDALGWGYVMNDVEQWAHRFLKIPFFGNGDNKPKEPSYIYIKDNRIENVLTMAKAVAREEADEYHDEMAIPRALLVTTVKPSGCRPWNALTTTDKGVLTLEELFEQHPLNQEWAEIEGYQAINSNEVNKITKTYVNGVAPVYKTSLWFGHELESTPNHRWFVTSKRLRYPGGETSKFEPVNEWVRTDELKEGYVIETKVGGYKKEEDETFVSLNSVAITMRCDGSVIKQPESMNPEIAWLLGYLWGDGSMSPSSFRIRFIDEYMYNLQKVQQILKQYFGLEADIKQCKDRNAFTLEVGSKMLWHWLIKNNIWKYYQDQLDIIPSVVRKSSKESIIAFIAGLIDSDGCVSGRNKWTKYTVYLSTAYDLFAQHLQEVALSVGLAFGRSLNKQGESKQRHKHIWNMTMTSYTDSSSFDVLTKHSNKISNALTQYPDLVWMFQTTNRSLKRLGEVKAVEYIGDKETFDVEVENSHYYYAGAFKSHNSISQLPGVSSGVHRPYAPYYLRNIRVSKNDPVAMALRFLEVPCYPENGQGEDLDGDQCNTWVFTFPVKTDAPIRSIDERAVDQLERYKQVMNNYVEHNCSVTISCAENEWDEVVDWLYKDENWNSFVGVSFLPRFDAENAPYPLMPYTSCTEEAYEEALARMESFCEEEFQALIAQYEIDEEEYDLGSDCSGASFCPVR